MLDVVGESIRRQALTFHRVAFGTVRDVPKIPYTPTDLWVQAMGRSQKLPCAKKPSSLNSQNVVSKHSIAGIVSLMKRLHGCYECLGGYCKFASQPDGYRKLPSFAVQPCSHRPEACLQLCV